MVFAGHVFPPVTPMQASDSGQRSLEHLSGFPNTCAGDGSAVIAGGTGLQRFLLGACSREEQGPTFARLAANHTWITPTLVVMTEVVNPGVVPNDSLLHYSATRSRRALAARDATGRTRVGGCGRRGGGSSRSVLIS